MRKCILIVMLFLVSCGMGAQTEANTTSMPVFYPPEDSYFTNITVTISSGSSDASVLWRTNTTMEWISGTTVYIDRNCLLSAKASKTGFYDSTSVTGVYSIYVASAVCTPAAGIYTNPVLVSFGCPTSNAFIEISTNGTTSWISTNRLWISNNRSVQVCTSKTGLTGPKVVVYDFFIRAKMPLFNIGSAPFTTTTNLTLKITCATPDANIYYVISNQFNTNKEFIGSELTVSNSCTIWARATKSGMAESLTNSVRITKN